MTNQFTHASTNGTKTSAPELRGGDRVTEVLAADHGGMRVPAARAVPVLQPHLQSGCELFGARVSPEGVTGMVRRVAGKLVWVHAASSGKYALTTCASPAGAGRL